MSLTVSTSCPSCGGVVEFEQGTNAVHCRFCGSDHFVTGRGRVLSYYVPEKVAVWEALSRAREALAGVGKGLKQTRDATLFFIPFYHFIGQDLRWEEKEKEDSPEHAVNIQRSVSVWTDDDMTRVIKGDGTPQLARKSFEPKSGYISRSMPALDIPELKVASLGVRADVLKLSLFERAAVTARGMVVPVRSAVKDYEDRGYAVAFGEGQVARAVFGKVRSVIYFPFWLVEAVGGDGDTAMYTVVDAVSGEVTNPRAPLSIIDKLVAHDGLKFDVAGLRPLKCPDCGNGLPLKPKDVVFVCGTCRKAWMINGDGFKGVPCSIAAPLKKGQGEPEYFPFWVVTVRLSSPELTVESKYDLEKLMPGIRVPQEADKDVPLRFFVPALRIGSQVALSRLATNFTRFQPVWEHDLPYSISAKGCYISPDDALTLVPLILFSMSPKDNIHKVRFALEAKVERLGTELALVPFYRGSGYYIDSMVGQSIQMNAVKD